MARLGRQTPTTSLILPYTETYGQEAIDLYNTTGRTAQEWQELMLYDILAINDEDLYVHTKFGYSVPRRNGKNEVVVMREMYGLMKGERILHTAHRTTTTHSAWERLLKLIEQTDLEIESTFKAFGKEHIFLTNGGRIEFRTRTSKGGLGEGFDLLIIDEAQEYQDDQETALKYVVSDSPNPQTLFCGTPPTAVSSGTVFTKLRKNALEGNSKNTAWAEWSVENMSNVNDIELWYQTNPSLGTILTERKIEDEIGTDEIDFNIQRLGLWIRYNQKSAISEKEWDSLKVDILPKLKGKLFVGIKYGHDGSNVSMSIAVKTDDERIFIETIDCQSVRNGNHWIINFLLQANVQSVVIDGANGQSILSKEMKEYKLKSPILPTVKEVIEANAIFEQGLFSKHICHKGQPSLVNVVTNCEKRAIGTNGGFGYKSIKDGADSSLLDSVIFAYWSCMTFKKASRQKVSY